MNITTELLYLFLIQTVSSLEKFIANNFLKSSFAFISSDFANLDDRLDFIFRLNRPKILTSYVTDLPSFDNYIVAESTSSDSVRFLYTPNNTINTRGRFLVILPDLTEDRIKWIFETLWSFYVYNVVAYVNWTTFITWYPYHPNNHCGTVTNLVTNVQQPYENKMPKYLQGCPINVTWDHLALEVKAPHDKKDPGHSVRVLDAVGELMDAKIEYLTENVKFGSPTLETMQLLMEDFQKRYINMGFWFMEGPSTLSPDLEASGPYQYTSCFFVLPPRRKITSSTETLVIFTATIWTLIAVSIVLMAVTLKIMCQTRLGESFFRVVRLVLQGSTDLTPKSSTKKLIFAIFLFYTTHLNWIYVSQLSGVLSQPSYEPKITTMTELALSDKKLKFNSFWDLYFVDHKTKKNLIKLKVQSVDGVPLEDEIADFAQDLDHGFINADVRQAFFRNPEKVIALTKDEITTLVAYVLVRKGFPFLDRINDGFSRILESGLIYYWIREGQVTINKTFVPDYEDIEGHLGLDRVITVFGFLGSGLLIAAVVFLLELVYGKVRTKNVEIMSI